MVFEFHFKFFVKFFRISSSFLVFPNKKHHCHSFLAFFYISFDWFFLSLLKETSLRTSYKNLLFYSISALCTWRVRQPESSCLCFSSLFFLFSAFVSLSFLPFALFAICKSPSHVFYLLLVHFIFFSPLSHALLLFRQKLIINSYSCQLVALG